MEEVFELINSHTLADNLDKAADVIKHLKITAYANHFLATNVENKNVYHSYLHSIVTMLNCYEGIMHCAEGGDTQKVQAIVLAGLFHDSKHLCGKTTSDKENIKLAVSSLEDAHDTVDQGTRVDASVLELAIDLIKCTEYPYTRKEPKSELHAIIRDADLMGIYLSDNTLKKSLIEGLYSEIQINRAHNYDDAMTRVAFYMGQQAFWNGVKWNSRYARIKSIKLNHPAKVRQWLELAK